MLGYKVKAELYGGFPTGYIRMATELKLLNGFSQTTGNITKGEKFAQILSPGNTAFAEVQNKLGRKAAYTYCFSRDLPGEDEPGAFHAGELWYEFETLTRCWRPFTGVDYDLSVAMASYFANFVKTGNPNSPELPEWTAFTEENRKCLELCEDIKMIDIE